MSRRTTPWGFLIFALGVATTLAGCSPGDPFDNQFAQYGRRSLTVEPTAGNAVAANAAIETIDPWPRHAYNKSIPGNGTLTVAAVRKYECGPDTSTGASQTQSSTSATGPGSSTTTSTTAAVTTNNCK